MVDGFLAIEKNRSMHAGKGLFSIIDATAGGRSSHLRSSNPNLNTPSRTHLITRSARGPPGSDTHQRRTFRSQNLPSLQRSARQSRRRHVLSNCKDVSDHIMFTLTSHERYKEMNPSSSPSFVEVSLAPEAAVPVTPEFA